MTLAGVEKIAESLNVDLVAQSGKRLAYLVLASGNVPRALVVGKAPAIAIGFTRVKTAALMSRDSVTTAALSQVVTSVLGMGTAQKRVRRAFATSVGRGIHVVFKMLLINAFRQTGVRSMCTALCVQGMDFVRPDPVYVPATTALQALRATTHWQEWFLEKDAMASAK